MSSKKIVTRPQSKPQTTSAQNTSSRNMKDKKPFIFEKRNYMLMILSLATICLGFVLMHGKENIYDFRKITLAPIVVVIGLLIGIYAIMAKPRNAE